MIEEIKRRLKQDEIDFSEENLKKAYIIKRYNITNIEDCLKEVVKDIKENKA